MNIVRGPQRERNLEWMGMDRIIPLRVDSQKRFVEIEAFCQRLKIARPYGIHFIVHGIEGQGNFGMGSI